MKNLKRRKDFIFLITILLIGIFLRFYRLGAHSLWFDEATSMMLTNVICEMITTSYFPTPPLFILLLRCWKTLGESELVLRILPFFFGVLSIVLIYSLGEILFDKKTGVMSAFLLAISPFHIYYSQELRPYTLAVLLVMFSVYYFVKSLKKNNLFSWVLFIIFTTLSLYTHSILLFILVVENFYFFLFIKKHKNIFIRWMFVQLTIFLLYLPQFFTLIDQLFNRKILDVFFWVPKPSWTTFIHTFNIFNLGYNGSRLIYYFGFFIFSSLFLYGVIVGSKYYRETLLLLSWLFIPLIGSALLSKFLDKASIYLYRIFIFVLPSYLIIIAYGIVNLRRYFSRFVVISIIVLTFISLYSYYKDIFYLPVIPYRPGVFVKKDNKSAAQYVAKNFREGDIIAHTCRSTYGAFLYYHKEKLDNRWVMLDYSKDWEHWSRVYPKESKKIVGFQKAVSIKQLVNNKKRLWLILSGWEINEIELPGVKEWLDDNYALLDEKEFKGIYVYLYDLRHKLKKNIQE